MHDQLLSSQRVKKAEGMASFSSSSSVFTCHRSLDPQLINVLWSSPLMDDAEMQDPLSPPPSLLPPAAITVLHSILHNCSTRQPAVPAKPQSVFTMRLTPSCYTATQLQDGRGAKCSLLFLLHSFFSCSLFCLSSSVLKMNCR